MLEHPGSDSRAIQELLEGRQAFDGALALDQRRRSPGGLGGQGRGDLPVFGERGTDLAIPLGRSRRCWRWGATVQGSAAHL